MSKSVTLIIEDGDLACWRPINNTFAFARREARKKWSRMRDHWNGLLIELGDYVEFKAKPKEQRRVFASVQFKDEGGRADTRLRDFFWIDIVAEHVKDRKLRSDPVRRDFRKWKVRTRGDRYFSDFGRITYWHDWDGYDIAVREHYLGGRLSLKYIFTLWDVGEVYVIPEDSGKDPEEIPLESVATIVVNGTREGRGPEGGTNDPPPKEP